MFLLSFQAMPDSMITTMNSTVLEAHVEQVCELINQRKVNGSRAIVGIAGPPASGKSTLAEAVVQSINQQHESPVPEAVLLPMDGFHLDNPILETRGLLSRKGAPETFNAVGFCEAIKQLSFADCDLYFPRFDRKLDLAIANAVTIHPQTEVVVVEGNYLLLKSAPWSSLADLFTATVFVNPDIEVLRERLYRRWIDHGLDPEAAMERATGNDLVNADLIVRESSRADLTLTNNQA